MKQPPKKERPTKQQRRQERDLQIVLMKASRPPKMDTCKCSNGVIIRF